MLISHGQPFNDISQYAFASRLRSASIIGLSDPWSLLLPHERLIIPRLAGRSTSCIDPYKTRYDLICHVLCRRVQHVLQLLSREALYDHILLLLAKLILFLKLLKFSLVCLAAGAKPTALAAEVHEVETGSLLEGLELFLVQALK